MTLILMIIIIKIFSGIFLCTLLGTILYLFWKAAGCLIEHKGYVDINYLIWKMVLLMFAIPITLIYANGFEKSTYVFEVTGPIKWVIGIITFLSGSQKYIPYTREEIIVQDIVLFLLYLVLSIVIDIIKEKKTS